MSFSLFILLVVFHNLKGFESSNFCSYLKCLISTQDVFDPVTDLFNNEPSYISVQVEELVTSNSTKSSPTKSIMKNSSDSPVVLENTVKSVQFASIEDEIVEDTPSPKLKNIKDFIKLAYKTKAHESVFTGSLLHDYEDESGDFWPNYSIPSDFAELIRNNFPMLERVKVTLNDLAGLVIFASHHCNLPYLYDLQKFVKFFKVFSNVFPSCNPLIKLLENNLNRGVFPKIIALEELLRIAFKNDYKYTIEAFYSLIGDQVIRIFIRNSIKNQNFKCFKRFSSMNHSLAPENLASMAIEHGNIPVFMELMQNNISAGKLCKKFDDPIVLSVVEDDLYFPGLIDLVAPVEGLKHFSRALTLSVTTKNIDNFKDLIKYDNSYFEKGHSHGYLEAMRSVFLNGKTEDFTFESSTDLKAFTLDLLAFDREDKLFLDVFRSLLPKIISSNLRDEVLVKAIFLKTSAYMNLILTYPGQTSSLTIGLLNGEYLGYYGIWEFLYDSKNYLQFMSKIVDLPEFNILHAIGNPDFPQSLWPQLIAKFKSQNGSLYIENQSFKNLSRQYGFINDSNLNGLGLELNKNWSLLDLAILNFNPIAVMELVGKFSDHFGIEASYELAKNYDLIINRNLNIFAHRIAGRMSIYETARNRHSKLFKKNSKVDPNFLMQLICSDLKSIVRILKTKLDDFYSTGVALIEYQT